MTGAGEEMPWGVPLAYLIAGVLLVLALRASGRTAVGSGVAGMALAMGTVLYTCNTAALPHLGGAILTGGASGLFIARRVGRATVLPLVAALLGASGLAMLMTCGAILLDPQSLFLADPDVEQVTGWVHMGIGLAATLGAVVGAGGIVAAFRLGRSQPDGYGPVSPLAVLGLLAAIIGCFGWSLGVIAFWVMAVLGVLAGALFLLPVSEARIAAMLALMGGALGWSAAVVGLVLQNPAMLVAGAAAGGFGAMRGMTALWRHRLSP